MKMGTTRSPKFRRLSRLTGLSVRETVGVLELLWLLAMEQAPAGDIGKWEDREIEDACDWPGEPGQLIAALVESGWLDPCAVHRLVVHDWHDHLPEFIRLRVKRGVLTIVRATPLARRSVDDPAVSGQRPDSDQTDRGQRPVGDQTDGGQRPVTDQSPTSRRTVAVDSQAKPSQAKSCQAKPRGVQGGFELGASAPRIEPASWDQVCDAFSAYLPRSSKLLENEARRNRMRILARDIAPTAPIDAIHGYAALHLTRSRAIGEWDPLRNFTPETIWRPANVAKYIDADRAARDAGMFRPYSVSSLPADTSERDRFERMMRDLTGSPGVPDGKLH